ncbi:monooxygenase [Neofusicoccum parvum]|uniref:Monooxygenase n=1 Tax=Neofusicoccum parvum TaxID=310453 RepID=A0ACB5SAZ1_9PEZI|nr:monooxygenase [Neofusicoccum parvum]
MELPHHTNAEGYFVPDTTYHDPKNRRMRVITIGAGFSGILLAYRLQRELENHTIYEKNGEIGGAWLENRYPNCACDVPSHSYVYPFALNPEWPEFYSKAESIWQYLDRVCRVFDLRKLMKFNHRVAAAVWDDAAGRWAVTIEKVYLDGSVEEIHDTCDVLLQAAGLLNNPIVPDIDGLAAFTGRVVHTAQWPASFGEAEWKGRSVVVVGNGASAVQTVPGMQPHVARLHVFVRSKTWLSSGMPDPPSLEWTPSQRRRMRENLDELVAEARKHECPVNGMWKSMFVAAPEQKQAAEAAAALMKDALGRDDLVDGFTPRFGYGCRRVSPGSQFMKAVGQPNVDVHFTSVVRLTPDGVVGKDGTEVKCDTVVFATGFDTTFRPHYKLVGQHGVSLAEKWRERPDGYLGVGCPGFPNWLTFFGPSWPVFAGSVTASLMAVADLAVKMVRKIQTDDIRSIAPRQDVTDAFNVHTQTVLHGTVWEGNCSSWYKDKNGRITAIWPGSGLHFQEVVREPRWEDYDIRYMNKHNMFAFMGRGFTRRERDPDSDMAPYFRVDALDARFYDGSVPWDDGRPVPTKESARLATAEEPPEWIRRSSKKVGALDVTAPNGDRQGVFAGATLVGVDEIGQEVLA